MRLAVALLAFAVLFQDPDKPCDLKRIEEGGWCVRCRKILKPGEKAGDFDKDGNCSACGSTPEKAKLCMKEWVPHCGMHDMQPHEKPCCTSPTCCRVEVVPALITYKCEGCGATASLEDKILHKRMPHERKAVPVCSLSGRFPHGGTLAKPDPPKKDPPPKPGERPDTPTK